MLFIVQAKTEAALGSTRGILDLAPLLSPNLLPKDSAKVGPEVAACQVLTLYLLYIRYLTLNSIPLSKPRMYISCKTTVCCGNLPDKPYHISSKQKTNYYPFLPFVGVGPVLIAN